MKNQFAIWQKNRFWQFALSVFLLSLFLGAAPAPQNVAIAPIIPDIAASEIVGPEPDLKAEEGDEVIALIASIASLVLVIAGGILLFTALSLHPAIAISMIVIGFALSISAISIDRSITKEARLFKKAEKARAPDVKPPKIKRSKRLKLALILASLSMYSILTIAATVGLLYLYILFIFLLIEEAGCF